MRKIHFLMLLKEKILNTFFPNISIYIFRGFKHFSTSKQETRFSCSPYRWQTFSRTVSSTSTCSLMISLLWPKRIHSHRTHGEISSCRSSFMAHALSQPSPVQTTHSVLNLEWYCTTTQSRHQALLLQIAKRITTMSVAMGITMTTTMATTTTTSMAMSNRTTMT